MPTLQPLRPIARRALAAQSDERLIRLLREGHEPAFEEIVRRYRGPLVGFATAIVSANGAEDVVQSSLAKAHSALLEDSREINLRPWLFAIVRNGALNAIRGEPRVDELDEALAAHSSTGDIAEQREELDRLVVAMCALPDAQRQALVKRELEGVGHGEIAAQLGTTSTAVRGLIFRARTQLRDALGVLVPLPILRTLLSQGTAIGAAGGGASAALIGGAGAKGGVAVAAAVLALGTGIAVESRRGDKDGDNSSVALANEGNHDASASSATSAAGSKSTAATELASETGRSGNESSPNAGSHGDGETSGGSHETGDSGGSGHSGGSAGGAPPAGSGDSSGPGGGHGTPTAPPPSGDDGSDHEGSGPSEGGDDHSGEDSSPEPPEVEDSSGPSDDSQEYEDEDEDDSSGPSGGGEDPPESEDHSGHGDGD